MIDGVSGPQGPTYEAGQRVSILGAEGVIDRIYDQTWWMYPLWGMEVLLDSGRRIMLTPDGRLYPEMEPILKVIGVAKRKVKRWQWVFKDLQGNSQITLLHFTEDEAKALYKEPIEKIEFSVIETEE